MTEPVAGPTAAEVDKARTALRDAANYLAVEQRRDIERDDGSRQQFTAPCRLDLIDEEINHGTPSSGGFAPRSKPPLWLDAAQFLADVETTTRDDAGDTTRERLLSWAAARASGKPALVVWAASRASGWRATADELLDPSAVVGIRGTACPECAAVRVFDRKDEGTGEVYFRPALGIDKEAGECRCAACRAWWPQQHWDHLVLVLEQQRHAPPAQVRARTAQEAGHRRVAG